MGRIRGHVRFGGGAGLLAMAVLAVACTGDDATEDGDGGDRGAAGGEAALTIEVLSSRPEFVSGGDALVAVTAHEDGVEVADVEITLGDTDVTGAFAADPDEPARMVGLVDGLDEGESTLTASSPESTSSAQITLTNHPAQGPMFSGEPLPLAACTTELFGLDPSTPEDGCTAPTEITWQYVDTGGALHDLADPTQAPDDADTVELDDGRTVPFVVRNEIGVLNRSVYRITLLDPDPRSDPRPTDVPETSAWNGRLVYRFGGGCGTTFTQGYFGTGEPPVEVLRRGYATATATFNTFQVMCNDVLSAETASMVKEHLAETYGPPEHTIGEGGSGGAIQQILIAQNYPGLLDAIVPSLPFPDALSIGGGVFDCALLTRYYATPEGRTLTAEQRAAINGHGVAGTCDLWTASFATNIDPARACTFDVAAVFTGGSGGSTGAFPSVPPEDVYDARTNPDGWRCDVWESNVAFTGRDPDSGFANSGYDNEGIQYGLDALNAGAITPDQFVDLNASIGGFDIDGQPQPERSVVAGELVERAYASGRVTGAYGGLPDTPIILIDVYTDLQGDIHDRVRAFTLLDRLAGTDDTDGGGGDADGGDGGDGGEVPATVSLWTLGADAGTSMAATLAGALGDLAAEPTFVMDEWLTAAEQHRAEEGGSWRDALAAAKPDAARSRCTVGGDEIVGPDANGDERCVEAYPVHEEPRMAAGMPRRGDLLKCRRIDLDEAAERGDVYEVELTAAQLDRLAEVFPTGVCDYTRPAVGQTEPDGTWQSFN